VAYAKATASGKEEGKEDHGAALVQRNSREDDCPVCYDCLGDEELEVKALAMRMRSA
jgi:hypothetical protein